MTVLDLPPTATDAQRCVAEYWPLIFAVCANNSRRLGVPAADLAHDVVIKVLEDFARVENGAVEPRALVLVRIKKVMRTTFLRRWRRLAITGDLLEPFAVDDPSRCAEHADLLARLPEMLDRLDDIDREAVELRFGLRGQEPLKGSALDRRLNVARTRSTQIVRAALRRLAAALGEDPERVGIRRGE